MALQECGRLKQLLIDTISLLCKNSLKYAVELKIEGVIGVTIDTDQVFLVHIDNTNKVEVKEKACAEAFHGSNAISAGYLSDDRKRWQPKITSCGTHHVTASDQTFANRNVLPRTATSTTVDRSAASWMNNSKVNEVDCHSSVNDSQHGPTHETDNENDDDVLCMTIEGDEESDCIDVYRSASYVKTEAEQSQRLSEPLNAASSSNVSTYDEFSVDTKSRPDEQFEHWNQTWPSLQQSDAYRMKGRSSAVNSTSRNRALKAYPSSSVKCYNSGGRGTFSSAMAVGADSTPISSMSSPDGAYTDSRATLQTRNIDGFSYGKQTVTNYVCNLCNASYKHHCNLLTHQVRVHGRPKKQLGRPPKPKLPASDFVLEH